MFVLKKISIKNNNNIHGSLHVMIIDDSKVILDRLVPLLTELENVALVLFGYSFEEGQKILSRNKIDVAVLDINLPGKSGIDLLEFIRNNNPLAKIVVIMMTDEASGAKKDLCLALGADHFLDKFEGLEKIQDIIKELGNDDFKIKPDASA